jgi:hypothetical protein
MKDNINYRMYFQIREHLFSLLLSFCTQLISTKDLKLNFFNRVDTYPDNKLSQSSVTEDGNTLDKLST